MAKAVLNPAFGLPNRSLGTLPTSLGSAKRADAHGVVPEMGTVSVEVSAATDVTIYVYSTNAAAFVLLGATTAQQTKSFSAAAVDYFVAPPGALFYLVAGTGSRTGYTNARALTEND